MILFLVTAALAAPDRLATTFQVGPTVTDIVVSPDGAWIGWNEADGAKFWVMDAGTFETTILDVCAGASGAAASGDMTLAGVSFYTGCEDGTVAVVEISTEGVITQREDALILGDGPITAVETDGDNVYAVLDDPKLGLVVAAVAVADGAALDGYPTELPQDTVEDTVLMDDVLVLAYGTEDVSKVLVGTGALTTVNSTLGGRTLVDAFPYDNGNTVYLADSSGGLVRFQSGSNDYLASLTNVADAITAVGILPSEGWMVLGAGEDDALLYSFTTAPGEQVGPIAGAANLNELVTIQGYAFGTTTDGTVLALTDRPWVTVSSLTPTSGVSGDEVSLTFSSDVAGDYEVVLNGTTLADGTSLAGPASVDADTPTTVTFTIESDVEYDEGANTIWVFVKDAAGLVGRGAGTLTIDNPPGKVSLEETDVAWGNETVTVSFMPLTATDIVSYEIYIDIAPFTAADYPTGGPTFSGIDDITAPLLVSPAPVAGVEFSQPIYPLTNGTTYYVAVRATDGSGLEGPMSAIIPTTPKETLSVSEYFGEEGGFLPPLCGFGGGAGSATIALAALAVARRRRRFAGGAAVLALAALAIRAPAAQAADEDEGPRTMNVQVRAGPTTIIDDYVRSVFGQKSNEIVWFEYGYASRFIDVNFGLGFYQEKGFLQTAAGEASGEKDTLTMVPLALTLTGRLDLFDEQPIVPFGRVGLDYWMFNEDWYVADEDTMDHVRTGGKYGWHFGGGLMILLDVFDRRAASRLEAISGINDTFVVAEYRNTRLIHGEDQINLSSSEVTFGLKFDF
ncbi:MAG: hypothetical protein Q7U06_01770 [Pseudomonadota bacterium]|nr:hypothetical protein [Pseudomonadota bacterium]